MRYYKNKHIKSLSINFYFKLLYFGTVDSILKHPSDRRLRYKQPNQNENIYKKRNEKT
jgi:hypothetical protein